MRGREGSRPKAEGMGWRRTRRTVIMLPPPPPAAAVLAACCWTARLQGAAAGVPVDAAPTALRLHTCRSTYRK